MTEKLKKLLKKYLTGRPCRGENSNMKTLGRYISLKYKIVPFMARCFRCGDARMAPKVPHRHRAVMGTFSALQKRRLLWKP